MTRADKIRVKRLRGVRMSEVWVTAEGVPMVTVQVAWWRRALWILEFRLRKALRKPMRAVRELWLLVGGIFGMGAYDG